jgi:hypothetical protein
MDPEPLPDDAFVVRGGVMDPRDMRTNAEDHHLEMEQEGRDEWAISVFSVPGMSADEIALGSPILNKKIRVTTVGAIRELGYDVTPSPQEHPLHADLRFMGEPTDDDFEALRRIFEPERPHPRLAEDHDA